MHAHINAHTYIRTYRHTQSRNRVIPSHGFCTFAILDIFSRSFALSSPSRLNVAIYDILRFHTMDHVTAFPKWPADSADDNVAQWGCELMAALTDKDDHWSAKFYVLEMSKLFLTRYVHLEGPSNLTKASARKAIAILSRFPNRVTVIVVFFFIIARIQPWYLY